MVSDREKAPFVTSHQTEPQHRSQPLKETAPTTLTAAVAAALGVACCWGLPLLLDALEIAAAWLTGLAAHHRVPLLTAAAVCLAAGTVLAWRDRSDPARRSDTIGAHPIVRRLVVGALLGGSVLLRVGYLYA